jgi:uncharacterized SAM-binding protein YcdF (DUF218 family)
MLFPFFSKLLGPAASPLVIACGLLVIVIFCVRRRPRLATAAACAALIVLLLASNWWVSMSMVDYLENRVIPDKPLPQAQAIVVLSSAAEPATPPQPTASIDGATANRLLEGVKLYREGKAPVVILSGGQLPWLKDLPPMSEGMAGIIESMGVPASAIIQEPDSGNTYQNALGVKAILAARNIQRILLVTSAMHMPRALALFRHQGIDATAAPCDFLSTPAGWRSHTADWQAVILALIPDPDALATTNMAIREFLGAAVYRARGLM